MKFAFKITLTTLTLISVLFSIFGVILINNNFNKTLEVETKKNINEHSILVYGIEGNIVSHLSDENVNKDELIKYLKNLTSYLTNQKKIKVLVNGEEVFSSIDKYYEYKFKNEDITYQILNESDMITTSSINVNNNKITVVNQFDISSLFKEKNENLSYFWKIDLLVILFSSIGCGLFSFLLTKNVRKLNEATKIISSGKYNERVKINSNDEIGELSNSYNRMIDTIEAKINELERSVVEREDFIANFSHELKNPMTSIIGYADLMLHEQLEEKERKKALEFIKQEGKRIENLGHKMMDLMELSNSKIKLEKTNIKAYFNKLKQPLTNSFYEVKLKFKIEEANVYIDEYLLEELIRNLIDNSRKAIKDNNTVEVVGKIENSKYKLSIVDYGIGIPESEIPRVTESFYMVNKSRIKKNSSNGIGLSIVKKIALLHGSDLAIESVFGNGTTISICLEMVL